MNDQEMASVALRLNGSDLDIEVPNTETLLETLHNRLGVTSVRSTCNIGICGACTVEIDGELQSACLVLTALCAGREVTTSEGLLTEGRVTDRVQQAFIDHSAFQCSYCIPAMVLATRALLREVPHPTRDQIRDHLSGNLCRCGSHPQILEAIESLTAKDGL